jgi:hypothetical protein
VFPPIRIYCVSAYPNLPRKFAELLQPVDMHSGPADPFFGLQIFETQEHGASKATKHGVAKSIREGLAVLGFVAVRVLFEHRGALMLGAASTPVPS